MPNRTLRILKQINILSKTKCCHLNHFFLSIISDSKIHSLLKLFDSIILIIHNFLITRICYFSFFKFDILQYFNYIRIENRPVKYKNIVNKVNSTKQPPFLSILKVSCYYELYATKNMEDCKNNFCSY